MLVAFLARFHLNDAPLAYLSWLCYIWDMILNVILNRSRTVRTPETQPTVRVQKSYTTTEGVSSLMSLVSKLAINKA